MQERDANFTHPTEAFSENLLRCRRLKHPSKIHIAHLNINSLRNKFLQLTELVEKNLDVLLISETKLDSSFTTAQFVIDGYHTPFRHDRNGKGGGLICFINENIICNRLEVESIPNDIEIMFIELNLRNHKWLLVSTYRPPNQCPEYFVKYITQTVSKLNYDNVVILGDVNLEPNNNQLEPLRTDLDLHNLIKEPTCFKSIDNPTCIDHIWVNQKNRFINSNTFETGLSDFHKMTITTLKASVPKRSPKIISYRDYKRFDKQTFKNDLKQSLETNGSNLNYYNFESKLQ